ncbi:MAG: hypothetical protein RR868_07075, partial [Muribaculaceae bacterium]
DLVFTTKVVFSALVFNFLIYFFTKTFRTILAGGSYFFQKHGPEIQWESLSKVNPSKSNMYIIDNANWVNLSVTYRLNFGRRFKKSGKSLSNSDNEGSAVTIK